VKNLRRWADEVTHRRVNCPRVIDSFENFCAIDRACVHDISTQSDVVHAVLVRNFHSAFHGTKFAEAWFKLRTKGDLMDSDVVTTLNTLIEASAQGKAAYRVEARETVDSNVAKLLHLMANRHATLGAQLSSVVLQMGGLPTHVMTIQAPERQWLELHDAIVQDNLPQTIRELERNEHLTLTSYEVALKSNSIGPPVRSLLNRHHDRISALLRLVRNLAGEAASEAALQDMNTLGQGMPAALLESLTAEALMQAADPTARWRLVDFDEPKR
jgi:uncharacterized protein (TIGR02284 family)